MESLAETPPDPNEANATTTLLDQAWGHSRAEVMSSIAGPALAKFMRPLYAPQLAPEEINRLPQLEKTIDLPDFARSVISMLYGRLAERIKENPEPPRQIDSLRSSMYHLFFHLGTPEIMQEGLGSGIIIPLQIATQIQSIETGNIPNEEGDNGYTDSPLEAMPFDNAALRKIMGRQSFGKILQRLTKGPNGYLGSSSVDAEHILDLDFYKFRDTRDGQGLSYWDAYALEDGQVVDLNQVFHLSAHNQRKSKTGPQTSSSGCPVRHRFKDADTGEVQEPLIDTSTKFLIATLAAVSPQNSEAMS